MADCALCYHSVMVKVLLTTKVNPTYDDLPEDRYHFPRTYLNTIEQAVGDWAIYYEPRRTSGDLSSRGGRMAYFATARITRLESDPSTHDHFYAYRSEEHTSELQSLMRNSYAVFCLKNKTQTHTQHH